MSGRKARQIKDLENRLERSSDQIVHWTNKSADCEMRLLDAVSNNEKLKAENKKLKASNDSLFYHASSLWGEEIRKNQQIRLQNEMIETIAKDLDDANKRKADLSKCFGYWLCETLRLRRECENLKKKVEYLSQFEMPNTNCLCQIRN